MKQIIALLSGLLFAFGLGISGMLQPEKVLSFLDVTGHWDPSLALVMGAALLVNIPVNWWILRRGRSYYSSELALPAQQNIDRPLVIGSAIFGIGWGVAGFCPGPLLAGMASGGTELWLVLAGFFAGMISAIFAKKILGTPRTARYIDSLSQ